MSGLLSGKHALIVGIANEQSIAFGVAQAMRQAGANIAVTYLNEKAERFVRPLAESLGASIIAPLDAAHPGQDEALFARISEEWGRLDIIVHSIAFAPRDDLQGRVLDSSAAGFATAMDISVHSFVRLCRLAEPLMTDGGACLTMSFYGAEKVVSTYNLMGPAKAALEAATREIASELGPKASPSMSCLPDPWRRGLPVALPVSIRC
jgi:enoyl-[acyl-carrier protein] reductase I